MRLTAKILGYALCLLLCYLLLVSALSKTGYRGQSLLSRLTHNSLHPGGLGFSLVRFREIRRYRNVDILFVGSSHCYRSFDPRIFQSRGLTVFNAGSRNQSPINTYFLLKRYLEGLNPRLVVMDASFETFQSREGLESFYDLSWNMPYSGEMMEMALASHHPYAINTAVSLMLDSFRPGYAEKFAALVQTPQPGKKYVPGGYVETHKVAPPIIDNPHDTVRLSEMQLSYFDAIIGLIQRHGIPMLVVAQPLPREYLKSIANYRAVTDTIAGIARRHGVPFVDFNDALTLDSRSCFMDNVHLNQKGVTLYDRYFLDQMVPSLATLLNRPTSSGGRHAALHRFPSQHP
jgi:hypothetical protein